MASAGGLRVVIKLPRRIQEEPRAPPYETEGTNQPSTKRKREVRGTKAWETTSKKERSETWKWSSSTTNEKRERKKKRCTSEDEPCQTIHSNASVKRPRLWYSPCVIRDGSHPDETHQQEILPHQQPDGSSKARCSTQTFVRREKKKEKENMPQ